jgi:hypothetical protein
MAVGLGSILLLALYSAFTFCFATVRTSQENIRATQITLARLERVRLCGFNQVTNVSLNPLTFTDVFDPIALAAGRGGIVYNGTFSAALPPSGSVPDSYRSNLFLVNVAVTWTNGTLHHSLSNQTYVALNGIESYVARSK